MRVSVFRCTWIGTQFSYSTYRWCRRTRAVRTLGVGLVGRRFPVGAHVRVGHGLQLTAARARGGAAVSDTNVPRPVPHMRPHSHRARAARTFLVVRARRRPLLPRWVPPGVLIAAAAAGRLRLVMDAVRLVGGMFSSAPSGWVSPRYGCSGARRTTLRTSPAMEPEGTGGAAARGGGMDERKLQWTAKVDAETAESYLPPIFRTRIALGALHSMGSGTPGPRRCNGHNDNAPGSAPTGLPRAQCTPANGRRTPPPSSAPACGPPGARASTLAQ
jgi:hypothetical protein